MEDAPGGGEGDGLRDAAKLELKPLKLLVYTVGGHFALHADTEKTPGMVASLALVVPGAYVGGALAIEHAGERLSFAADGAAAWRWAAWFSDCRHALEPVEEGVRIALTFAIAIDPETPLTAVEAADRRVGSAAWERTYAEWHTAWAARGARTRAGNEQYGQKLVWVLAHRYTSTGLRASLLKGRDRELARLLAGELDEEAAYLGWLQIREVGSAMSPEGWIWGDHQIMWHESEPEEEPRPAARSGRRAGHGARGIERPALRRIAHLDTPELHLDDVARQNAWVEGLRSLSAEAVDHGPIEVLDGEIVPEGALREAVPDGARLYEATGTRVRPSSFSTGARCSWCGVGTRRRFGCSARCGGRRALAVELAERSKIRGPNTGAVCRRCSSCGPRRSRPTAGDRSHGPTACSSMRWFARQVRDAMSGVGPCTSRRSREWTLTPRRCRRSFAGSRERVQAGEPVDAWVRALGPGCSGFSPADVLSGARHSFAPFARHRRPGPSQSSSSPGRHEPPTTREAVLAHADWLDEPDRRAGMDAAARCAEDGGRCATRGSGESANERESAGGALAGSRLEGEPVRTGVGLAHAARVGVGAARVDQVTAAARGGHCGVLRACLFRR